MGEGGQEEAGGKGLTLPPSSGAQADGAGLGRTLEHKVRVGVLRTTQLVRAWTCASERE